MPTLRFGRDSLAGAALEITVIDNSHARWGENSTRPYGCTDSWQFEPGFDACIWGRHW